MKPLCIAAFVLAVLIQPAAAAEHPIHELIRKKCEIEFSDKRVANEKANYYTPLVLKYARRYDLPANIVASVVWHESNYRKRSTSSCGAIGLMQVMPFPGRFPRGSNPYDPEVNLNAGCRLLKGYLMQFKGDWHQALTAYNWGPAYVSRGMYRSRYSRAVLRSAGH